MVTGKTCNNLPNFAHEYPYKYSRSFGNFITDSIYMVCNPNSCYTWDVTDPNATFIQGPNLNYSYAEFNEYPIAIPFKNGSLWIIGNQKNHTEIITFNEPNASPGPKLPRPLEGPCVVKLSESTVAIFDGISVFLHDLETGLWSYGPNKTKAYDSGCAAFRHSNKLYLIVGGGWKSHRVEHANDDHDFDLHFYGVTTKTEILDVENLQWFEGKTEN